MCIAILNQESEISRESLFNCWESNDDGAGILYIENGKLGVFKQANSGNKAFNQFYQKYKELYAKRNDMPLLLHFRIATHGFSEKFLHPFLVSDTLGLIHNGIISGLGTPQYSDTAEFRDIIAGVPDEWKKDISLFDIPMVDSYVRDLLGTYNKVVFLDANGEWTIYNETSGIWDDGNWYSNSAYKTRTRYYGHHAQSSMTAMYPYARTYTDTYDDWEDVSSTHDAKLFECSTCMDIHGGKAMRYVDHDACCVECGMYIDAAVDYVINNQIELEDGIL